MEKKVYSIIGERKPRIDGVAKVTGYAKYADDLTLPGMLFGKILRSPHPHARIVHVDTSRAKRLPGVKAVITAEDTLCIPYGVIDVERYAPPGVGEKEAFLYPNDKLPLALERSVTWGTKWRQWQRWTKTLLWRPWS